jgi:vacuolar-type H+-ATPase subunit E/Vma4
MNNEDKILEAIRLRAEDKASAVRRETDAQIASVNEDCDNRIRDMRAKNAAKCERERDVILRRGRGSSDMRRREIMLGARVKLLDRAYEEAQRFICSMDRDAYAGLLSNMLADALLDRIAEDRALAECGEEVAKAAFEVSFNEKDKGEIGSRVISLALDRVASKGETAPELVLSEKTARVEGGFILRSGDVECDCSVRTLVAASRAATEADVARVLFQ